MARGKKAQFSKSGISIPDYSLIQAGMKPIKQGELQRDYDRLMQDALWYVHYEVDTKTLAKELVRYVERHVDKTVAAAIKEAPAHLMAVPGKLAYIALKGATLSEQHQQDILGTLPAIQEYMNTRQPEQVTEESEAPAKHNVISIQDRMRDQVADLIGSFEQLLDEYLDGTNDLRKFSPHNQMLSYENTTIKPAHAKLIRSHFEPMLAEAQLVAEFTDPEIKEAYQHFTARAAERKRFLKFYEDIITACDTIINTGRAQRKTRVKRAPSKEKLVAKLKFKANEPSIGAASINPLSIPGSRILWVYNTKTRKLGKYVADELLGELSVKGTTITGFDPKLSTMRTVRKPEILKGSNKLSRTKMDKLYGDLTTAEVKQNGRINEHMVLLSVF